MKLSLKKSVLTRTLTSLTTCVIVAALSGCSDAEADNPDLDETTDASVSDPTEYIPASEEGPAQNVPAPKLPAAISENSEEGAEARLKFVWEGIDYARMTVETESLSLVSHEVCEFCEDHIEGWESRYANGDWAVLHGEVEVEIDQITTHFDDVRDDEWVEMSFLLIEPPADLYVEEARDDGESLNEESEAKWLADLSFDGTAQRWKVEWLGLQESPEGSQ